MLWHGRPYGCGSWLPEDKKANVWHGREKCFGLWQPAFPAPNASGFFFRTIANPVIPRNSAQFLAMVHRWKSQYNVSMSYINLNIFNIIFLITIICLESFETRSNRK